ncbi:MAG: heme-binding protein [Pyrinomonadaceae bacterium]
MLGRFRIGKPQLLTGVLLSFLSIVPVTAQTQLTAGDVQSIIARAVSAAVALNQRVTVSVTDHEGHLLGTFTMTGAPSTTRVRSVGRAGQGLEDLLVSSAAASQSKAGTAALFSTAGNAFTTRTAGFIIQEHFPPGVNDRPGGPLYGVQFSSLACSDIAIAGLPLGLSADPGGLPLYRNGVSIGGVGVEGDGLYTVDRDPNDLDQPAEELIAAAAARGFEAPASIRADNILVEGIRLPYSNVADPPTPAQIPFGSLPGVVTSPISGAFPSDFVASTAGGVAGERSSRFPTVAGATLTAAETDQIIADAAVMANITRAAIRQPIGSNARVTVAVVDVNGAVTGIFRQQDAPVFGLDVAVQKARTVAFMSRADAAAKLSAAGFGSWVSRAAADGIALNGAIAFSDRGFGFLHRPFLPDGINTSNAGPFSTAYADWSPFNVGLQLDLVRTAIVSPPMMCASSGMKKRSMLVPCPCTNVAELKNGIQIFAGAVPLYRGGTLIGGIGISGDGIDQDDLIAAAGANRFPPPDAIRSDRFFVRGVRLPFLKFPARPTLP